MKKLIPFLLLFVSLGLFFSVTVQTHRKVGENFPGYLTFENGVVGAFYVSDWSGPKQGLKYHSLAPTKDAQFTAFTEKDFLLVSLLPALSGLLFFCIGMAIFYYLPLKGRYAFLILHFLAGNYLILCPDFHLTYQYTYLLMIFFSFIPAAAIHFSLLFPEEQKEIRPHPWFYILPYLVSAVLCVPYLAVFHQVQTWMEIEMTVFCYLVLAYIFWIYRLIRTFNQPQLEANRIIARYLLIGQLIAFAVPAMATIAILIGGYSFPLNFAAPIALLFPISLFMGVILARLRQSQIQLIQSEKNAALGNLLAALAHEINNPMTFIYSSIEPLRELMKELKSNPTSKSWTDVDELVDVIEEGAVRSKDIIESFRYFSHPEQKELHATDLHAIIDQSLELMKPKWHNRIQIQKNYGNLPEFKCQPTEMGQIFVNLISNACYAIAASGTITITTRCTNDRINISVKDTGTGMNKEIVSKIFDAFYTTKPQGEGTGLGLSTTLELVKKYNGNIEVKSEPVKGSEFIIQLPVNT